MAEAKNAATINRLMSKRPSVLYFPNSTLLSRVKGHKGSPVLPRLLPSIVMGSLLWRAHFESLRAAEAKNSATINQLKYRSRSCITENIALGAWSRANKALGCASCFIGSRPRPRAIFPVMHSHGTLISIYYTTDPFCPNVASQIGIEPVRLSQQFSASILLQSGLG